MPPKKKDAPSKKTEIKKKEKVIEDKTFGLKNKKGKKQQVFIQQVQKQVMTPNVKNSKSDQQAELERKRLAEKKKKDELNDLFRPVQNISKGADPKSVLCAFFKQGACGKGAKCKFSHDLNIEKKTEKRNMYAEEEDKNDAMDGWDQATLEDAVNKKHGSKNKGLPPTTIICKHFLEAVDNGKYGWFWECPGGEKCHYKHALPQGYVLKRDKKKMEEQQQTISLEELIERERAKLGGNLTKVTIETFLVWKAKKKAEKQKKFEESSAKKSKDIKAGKMFGFSGKDLFTFNPDLVTGDDDDADDVVIEREVDPEEDDTVQVKEIDLTEFAYTASRAAAPPSVTPVGGISQDTGERFRDIQYELAKKGELSEEDKLDMAAAPDPAATDAAIAAAMAATVDAEADVPIDENLFGDDDLEMLDDDLEQLDLE